MNVTLGQILTENGEVSSSSISNFGVCGMDPPEGDKAETDFDLGPKSFIMEVSILVEGSTREDIHQRSSAEHLDNLVRSLRPFLGVSSSITHVNVICQAR